MAKTKKPEYAHVLAGREGNMARFQLVFDDGRPVDEFQIPVAELDKQRSAVCDTFLREMKHHGIRTPDQYRFVDQTLRGFNRGKHTEGYGTLNVQGLGDIQRMKYEDYLRSGLTGGRQAA